MDKDNKKRAQEFRTLIEAEILKILGGLSQDGEIPEDKLQQIAQHALDTVTPDMTLQELYQAAVKLDDHYPELAPVVRHVMQEYEDKYEHKTLEEVSHLVKSGKYDEAQDAVKKVLEFKIQDNG